MVSVIIPNYNGEKFLEKCIDSFGEERQQCEIIVVDNGSTDGSVETLLGYGDKVKLIPLEVNAGFASACDIGARQARGDVLFFFNNDAWLVPGALDIMVDYMDANRLSVVGPKILNTDGTLQSGPMSIDWLGHPGLSTSDKIFYATGTALLMRKELYLTLGGFDTAYFAFWEEIDLLWRAHLRKQSVGYCSSAVVYHQGGGTIGSSGSEGVFNYHHNYLRLFLGRRNCLVTILKNYSILSLLFILPMWGVESLSELVVSFLLGRLGVVRAYWNGAVWIFENRRYILEKRRQIQASRMVSDRWILKRMLFPFLKIRYAFGGILRTAVQSRSKSA